MKAQSLVLALTAMSVLLTGGCSKPADVKSSVAELEQAFQAPPAPAPAAGAPAPTPATGSAEAQDLVKSALAAARADDYAIGVTALQAARSKPGVSAEQLMAVQRAMQAMTTDLATRAANGDQKALAELKAIERTRSQ